MSAKVLTTVLTFLLCLSLWGLSVDDTTLGFPYPDYELPESANDSALRELGRHLFYDPILSIDSSTSCATCHQQFSAFAHIDHTLSHGVLGRVGKRNVPALQNLAWQTSYMWDGAIEHLDMQSISPITGHDELGETMPNILHKIRSAPRYALRFLGAYNSDTISVPRILTALGRFCASLVSGKSRYDNYISGKDTFSIQEHRGLTLFRRHCSPCHTEPLFTNNEFVSNGIHVDSALMDIGRAKVSRVDKDDYTFRVPSLRNIAVTHPYMHDGRFRRLRDVLLHYSSPDKYASHADPRLRTIGVLNDGERKDIIAFLLTLTDNDFLNNARFADPTTAQPLGNK